MGESLSGIKRTHMCGTLREANIDEKVTVMGWVQRKRNFGSLIFVDLRDKTGILQIVFGEEINSESYQKIDDVKSEYCILVQGTLKKRESVNNNIPTGQVELLGENLKILSSSETPPIYIKENLDAQEAVRLKYRYLDLRRPDMQNIFKIRHKASKVIRDYLDENDFLEIETPILNKPTPEGARDYLVPSRKHTGLFYALPQSPQIFKQLLMVSGFDKYFQIARCFRDEDLRANRQPEFTQVDIEMSFVEIEDVINVNEGLMQRLFNEVLNIDVKIPFKRMNYDEAMNKYGSDKPDLRFGLEINDITNIVKDIDFAPFNESKTEGNSIRAIIVPNGSSTSRKEIDKYTEFVKTYGAKGLPYLLIKNGEVKCSFQKFLKDGELENIIKNLSLNEGDLLFIICGKNSMVLQTLGALRLEVSKKMDLIKDKNEFNFVWITDFPLLEFDEEENRYVACHHPFTSPRDEDIDLLDTNPGKVKAKAYDLVLNGEELGGGSIRIHDSSLQNKMFKVLGLTDEMVNQKFGFLLEAFKYGPPPHGGIAYGLDRIVMFLSNTNNIKDVIAFPKNQNAACPLTDAPSIADETQLNELGIKITNK